MNLFCHREEAEVAVYVEELVSTLTEQHRHIKTLMETVSTSQDTARSDAFAELCYFLAAHEAAEEECIHSAAQELMEGDTTVVDQRIEEEDQAGQAIAELERLGTDSSDFPDKFEMFRRAVIAHAEAEEHEELPKLGGTLDATDVTRMREALSRVPDLASRNGDTGTTFRDRLQAARADFRAGSSSGYSGM